MGNTSPPPGSSVTRVTFPVRPSSRETETKGFVPPSAADRSDPDRAASGRHLDRGPPHIEPRFDLAGVGGDSRDGSGAARVEHPDAPSPTATLPGSVRVFVNESTSRPGAEIAATPWASGAEADVSSEVARRRLLQRRRRAGGRRPRRSAPPPAASSPAAASGRRRRAPGPGGGWPPRAHGATDRARAHARGAPGVPPGRPRGPPTAGRIGRAPASAARGSPPAADARAPAGSAPARARHAGRARGRRRFAPPAPRAAAPRAGRSPPARSPRRGSPQAPGRATGRVPRAASPPPCRRRPTRAAPGPRRAAPRSAPRRRRGRRERVPVSPRLERVVAERLAQSRHVDLHALGRGTRRLLTPELVDDPLRRDGLAAMEQQQGEHRPLLRRPEVDPLALPPRLERSRVGGTPGPMGLHGATLPLPWVVFAGREPRPRTLSPFPSHQAKRRPT